MKNDASVYDLLRQLVHTPSQSFEEEAAAAWVSWWLDKRGITHAVPKGNVVATAAPADAGKPTLALIAHLDTVAPAIGYTRDPYDPGTDPDIIWGLGANDDGGSVAAMLAAFSYFYGKPLPINLLLLLVREEECSGPDGAAWLFGAEGPFGLRQDDPDWLPKPDWAIVGEPTGMKAATSERGLLVLDGEAHGESGHAARGDGVNALYIALEDIDKLRGHHFKRNSAEMGEVRVSVTQIDAGRAHNVIPDRCHFVVDIRPNECYTPKEVLDELQSECRSVLRPRNLKHRASATAADSLLRKTVADLHIETFSSPTTSDWMQLTCDAIKMGPGDSARSHKADEFIRTGEIAAAIDGYIHFIEHFYGNTLE